MSMYRSYVLFCVIIFERCEWLEGQLCYTSVNSIDFNAKYVILFVLNKFELNNVQNLLKKNDLFDFSETLKMYFFKYVLSFFLKVKEKYKSAQILASF